LEFVHARFPEHSLNLIGHSMGGSIATKTAFKIEKEMGHSPLSKALQSIFIIDVVEGTAIEALPFMHQIVQNRPNKFKDITSVIKYGISSG
jgi:protein phosphatase methylesterase 1